MLNQLRTLIAIADTGQLSTAADLLQVNQSTVSIRLAALEKSVGATLVVRGSRTATLTTAGELLYASAQQILGTWADTCAEVNSLGKQNPAFKVVFSHTTSSRLMGRFYRAIQPWLDRIQLTIAVENSTEIMAEIESGQASLGFIEKPMANNKVACIPLCKDRLVKAGTTGPWLIREPGSGVRYFTELYLKSENIHPEQLVEVHSNAAIIQLISDGCGQSLLSADIIPPGIPVQDLPAEYTRNFYCLTPRHGRTQLSQELAAAAIAALGD